MNHKALVRLTEVPEHRPYVTVRWLRRACAERRLPFYKLGPGTKAPVLINLDDLDALAESGKVEAK